MITPLGTVVDASGEQIVCTIRYSDVSFAEFWSSPKARKWWRKHRGHDNRNRITKRRPISWDPTGPTTFERVRRAEASRVHTAYHRRNR